MKKKFKAISLYVVAFSAGVIGLSACVADSDSPGLEYTPDMYRSPAIEPYVDYGEIRGNENKSLKVVQSAMQPPHGSIPYYGTDQAKVEMMLPYKRKASSAANVTHGLYQKDGWIISDSLNTDYNEAAVDKNPIVLTEDNKDAIFDKGKRIYNNMCAHCHGEKGDGQGPLMTNGVYSGVPDYTTTLKDLPDGQVFYSIYYGKGAMGAHSMLLDKEEIWTIVHYINKLRLDDYGDFDKVESNEESEESSEVNDENQEEL